MSVHDDFSAWIDAHRPSDEGVWCLSDSAIKELEAFAERFEDESTRLRSCLSDDAENAEMLMAENAKLRELVRDMYKAFMHGNCYRWCEFEPCNFISEGKCRFYDRMRELGIEVG